MRRDPISYSKSTMRLLSVSLRIKIRVKTYIFKYLLTPFEIKDGASNMRDKITIKFRKIYQNV